MPRVFAPFVLFLAAVASANANIISDAVDAAGSAAAGAAESVGDAVANATGDAVDAAMSKASDIYDDAGSAVSDAIDKVKNETTNGVAVPVATASTIVAVTATTTLALGFTML